MVQVGSGQPTPLAPSGPKAANTDNAGQLSGPATSGASGPQPSASGPAINQGPSQDTFEGNNDIFAGALDKNDPAPNTGNASSEGIAVPPVGTPAQGLDAEAIADGGRQHPNLLVTDPNEYRETVDAALTKNGLEPEKYTNTVLAMIWQESKGDPMAVGSDGQGSRGVMQVIAGNQKPGEDHFDPEVSINAGVEHFATELKNQGGDLTLALGAYNQGEGAKTSQYAQTYSTQIQNKSKFFEGGGTPAGKPDPTSPGFIEPEIGAPSGEGGTVTGGGASSGPANKQSGPVNSPSGPVGDPSGPANGPSGVMSGPETPGMSGPANGTGTGSAYVDSMMQAFDDLGAPQDLKDAYMEQYRLLGMLPGGETPGGGDYPGVSGPGAVSGPGGMSGASGPGAVSGPGGMSGASGPGAVSGPGGMSGASGPGSGGGGGPAGSGGNNAGNPADAPPESEIFTNAGPVNWAAAPADLQQYQQEISSASEKTGVPESIIAGALWAESRGDLNASTNAGQDNGLMQVNNETYSAYIAGQYGLPAGDTPIDAENNILAGAAYLKQLKEGPTAGLPGGGGFGTWDMAIRAYNSGEYSGVDFSNPDKFGPSNTGKSWHVQAVRVFVEDFMGNGLPKDREYQEADFLAMLGQ